MAVIFWKILKSVAKDLSPVALSTMVSFLTIAGTGIASERQSVSIDLESSSIANPVCVKYALLIRIHFEGLARFTVSEGPEDADVQISIGCKNANLTAGLKVLRITDLSPGKSKQKELSHTLANLNFPIPTGDEVLLRKKAYEISLRIQAAIPWTAEVLSLDLENKSLVLSIGKLNVPGLTICQPFQIAQLDGIRKGKLDMPRIGFALIKKIGSFESIANFYFENESPQEFPANSRIIARQYPIKRQESTVRNAVSECIGKVQIEPLPASSGQPEPDPEKTFSLPPVMELIEIKGIRQLMGLSVYRAAAQNGSATATGAALRISNTVNISKYFILDAQGLKDIYSGPYRQSVQEDEALPQVASGNIFFSLSVPIRDFYIYAGFGGMFDKINMPYIGTEKLKEIEIQRAQGVDPGTKPDVGSAIKSRLRGAGLLALSGQVSAFEFSFQLNGSSVRARQYVGVCLDVNYRFTPTWIGGIGLSQYTFSKGDDREPAVQLQAMGAHLGFLLGGVRGSKP